MNNSLFLPVLFLIISFNAKGQRPEITGLTSFPVGANIQSPNSSSLGTYGSIPVSLYNGTPNVSVPIYIINEGGIPLDISLHHDASGVRVNSVSGWVGQNWTLQAGGLIERSVRGRSSDEFDVTRGNNNYAELHPNFNNWGDKKIYLWNGDGFWPWWNQGYKYNASILAKSNWSSKQNFDSLFWGSYYTNN